MEGEVAADLPALRPLVEQSGRLAPLADLGLQALRQSFDPLATADLAGNGFDLVITNAILTGVLDIFHDGTIDMVSELCMY